MKYFFKYWIDWLFIMNYIVLKHNSWSESGLLSLGFFDFSLIIYWSLASMKYRDTYRIVTQVSRYVSHRDVMYRATPSDVCPNRGEMHRIDGSWSSVLSVRTPSLIVLLPFCPYDYLTPA